MFIYTYTCIHKYFGLKYKHALTHTPRDQTTNMCASLCVCVCVCMHIYPYVYIPVMNTRTAMFTMITK